jgi:hypothetical protein
VNRQSHRCDGWKWAKEIRAEDNHGLREFRPLQTLHPVTALYEIKMLKDIRNRIGKRERTGSEG